MKNQNYYLGLDIGTSSVGYAVTDPDYKLLKKGGEPMWGVHLFDEAESAAERRGLRVSRRRLNRRQWRVRLVQELFAAEIGKIDPRFFIRLQESALYRDDAQEPFAVFNDKDYTDKEYHKKYPTIHHLIHELMTSDEPHDVRLVYLACAWLVAHRGHFLSDVSIDNVAALAESSSFERVYQDLVDYILSINSETIIPWHDFDIAELANILKSRLTPAKKSSQVSALLFGKGKIPAEIEGFPYHAGILIDAICGKENIVLHNLFHNDEYDTEAFEGFSLVKNDDDIATVLPLLSDDAELILRLKAIYDWSVLATLLDSRTSADSHSISAIKVGIYEQHKKDLATLKRFIRKYLPEKYNEVFREIRSGNYVSYSYHLPKNATGTDVKKTSKDAFNAYLRSLFKQIKVSEEDAAVYADMKARIETNSFMPKQIDTDNRVIPSQLYQYELITLLDRAKKYLPFLSVADAEGLTVCDKLLHIFTFRVPYYVGPLKGNENSDHFWAKRYPGKEKEKIYPWNFSNIIDEDASELGFINKMLNYCTYLPDQPVAPKCSLLYQRYSVLNEINKLRINDNPITVEQKQRLYNEVFMVRPKVKTKDIVEFFRLNYGFDKAVDRLTGFEETALSSLSSHIDFARLIGSGTLTEEQAEDIISRITYSQDPQRIKKYLTSAYPSLNAKDVDYLCHRSYKDFGRLSVFFLCHLEGAGKETDKITSIIRELWNTNYNLNELLSDRYTFKAAIDAYQTEYYTGHTQSITDQLDQMYLSNPVKRSIRRALQITKEVVKATGKAPEKIFVEVTRGANADQKNKRTTSRQQQIRELYAKCDHEDIRRLTQ